MKHIGKSRTEIMRRSICFIFAILLFLSSVLSAAPQDAFASVATGSSGSISVANATAGQAGGILYLDKVAFRIGVSRSKDMYNTGNSYKKQVAENYSYKAPNTDDALTFVPVGEWVSNYEVGRYIPSSGKLLKYNSGQYKKSVIKLKAYKSSQKNVLKAKLSKYTDTGVGKKKAFKSLIKKSAWKKLAKKLSREQARDVFEYILKPDGSGKYDVSNRMNTFISKYASNEDISKLNYNQAQDVKRGWLGLLMAMWRMAPAGSDQKDKLEDAITDYLNNKGQTKEGKPVSLVVDTATTLTWRSGGPKLIIPSLDYLEYYGHIGTTYSMTQGKASYTDADSKIDVYEGMKDIYTKDKQASPNKYRISNSYNANNVFSFGISGVAKGSHWLNSIPAKAFQWSSGSVIYDGGIMDTLKLYKDVYGINVANFGSLPVKPTLVARWNSLKATKSTKIKADQKTLKSKNQIQVYLNLDKQQLNTWGKVYDDNKSTMKTVTYKVVPSRSTAKTKGSSIKAPKYEKNKTYGGYFNKGIKLSWKKYQKLLQGGNQKIVDDVSKQTIKEDEKITYSYKPSFKVTYKAYGGTSSLKYQLDTRKVAYTKGKNDKPLEPPKISFSLDAKIDGKKTKTLPGGTSKIGSPVDLVAKSNATSAEKNDFATYVNTSEAAKNNNNIDVQFTLKRGSVSDPDIDVFLTEPNFKVTSGSDYTEKVKITKAEALALVNGTKTYTLQDLGVKEETLMNNQSVEPNYTLDVEFIVHDETNAEESLTSNSSSSVVIKQGTSGDQPICPQDTDVEGVPQEDIVDGESDDDNYDCGGSPIDPDIPDDDICVQNPNDPDCQNNVCPDDDPSCVDPEDECIPGVTDDKCCPEDSTDPACQGEEDEPLQYTKMSYTSEPSAYSELKENQPDGESFEAMAGVPSTQKLYFSVGGSEFVVDAEFEYIQNATSVWRTYKSKFTGTPSEFKNGDTWKGMSVPSAPGASSQNVRIGSHDGGTVTATWTGTTPYTGNLSWSDHSQSGADKWDDSPYEKALAQAEAWAATVNGTIAEWTSASDNKHRTWNSWGAHITTNSNSHPAGFVNIGHDDIWGTCGSGENTYSCITSPYVATTGKQGTNGSYTITVVGTMPPDVVCGPECRYDLPDVEDTWKQKISYDYMKIIRADVYQLSEGRLKNMGDVFGDENEELLATLQRGGVSIFSNIAQMNAINATGSKYDGETENTKNNGSTEENRYKWEQSSEMGRIRYSLDENQDDTVVYDEGTRTNKSAGEGFNYSSNSPQGGGHSNWWAQKGILYNNPNYTTVKDYHKKTGGTNTATSIKPDSYDLQTPEWKKFDERRNQKVTATVISDMLVLQTSAGDQSVMYHDKNSETVTAQEDFPDIETTKEELWDNNPLSAVNWQTNHILVGSYNGHYEESGTSESTNKKYWGYQQDTRTFTNSIGTINTRFDNNGAGIKQADKRPTRGSKLYIYKQDQIVRTTPNGLYNTGASSAFYKQLLNWESPNAYAQYDDQVELDDFTYTAAEQGDFDDQLGFTLDTDYSDSIAGTNSIVIHTPVSVEDAMLISLPASRDQRTEMPEGGAASLINDLNLQANKDATAPKDLDIDPYVKTHVVEKTTKQKTTTTEYVKAEPVNETFSATGKTQTFTAPADGTYQIDAYGAQGGANTTNANAKGGLGGYVSGKVTLKKGDTLQLNVGTRGASVSAGIDGSSTQQNSGGFNGGGYGTGTAGPGGGGASDVRLGGTSETDRILVAGGGGGGYDPDTSSDNGNEGGNTSNLTTTSKGANGRNGMSGNYAIDNAGGGGGYLGGTNLTGEDAYGAYGGSNYIASTVTDASQEKGVNEGQGRIVIKSLQYDSSNKEDSVVKLDPQVYYDEYTEEAGDGDSYNGWTWEQLFGANWKDYLKETTTVEKATTTKNTTSVYEDGKLKSSTINKTDADGNTTTTGNDGVSSGKSYNFPYSGSVQTFTAPATGTYQLEVWGAEGGGSALSGNSNSGLGGKGGYSKGLINLIKGETVNVYVGGRGQSADTGTAQGGWNGGGSGYGSSNGEPGNGGGGSTDIRQNGTDLSNRVIVAGGGGGGGEDTSDPYGHGGGTEGVGYTGFDATQTSAGPNGTLGQGASTLYGDGGGGGGGYYGGGSLQSTSTGTDTQGGGAGSGFIGKVTNGTTLAGNTSFLNPLTGGKETGHSGDGYARITYTTQGIIDTTDAYKQTTDSSSTSTAGTPVTFDYKGTVQTFTAPATGTYQLEVWGAQGGNVTTTSTATGGKGGYSKGTVTLNKGETINVYVGGQGTEIIGTNAETGGWNGGGGNYSAGGGATGGGATDIRKGGTSLTDRIIVAGGGSGAAWGNVNGASGGGLKGSDGESWSGYASGLGGTQTSGGGYSGTPSGGGQYQTVTNGTLGIGGRGSGSSSGGSGGGGGYYGGGGGMISAGGGGSGYIGGVTDGAMDSGVNIGNGKAIITPLQTGPNQVTETIVDSEEVETTTTTTTRTIDEDKVLKDIDTFPDFMPDGTYNPIKAGFGVEAPTPKSPLDDETTTSTGAKIRLGTFINLDWGFQIYFPNTGSFAQQPNLLGIANTTQTRGLGFYNGMDLTKYTDNKQVKFQFAVIYEGHSYPADTWIDLDVNQTIFDFYAPLGNSEASGAAVEFQSAPINGLPTGEPVNTNQSAPTNKERNVYDLAAEHGAYKETFVDVVGRIGNLAVDDTDDFRFSNLFKQPICGEDCELDDWLVQGLVKKVDDSIQKGYYADKVDIRGEEVTREFGLNTWGTQDWYNTAKSYELPINPKDNEEPSLREEFLKPGYDIYNEISTIGNYQNGVVTMTPYYYKLDVDTGEVTPLDVYQTVGGQYQLINQYKGADDDTLPENLVEYNLILNWMAENARRNYHMKESEITQRVSEKMGESVYGYMHVPDLGGQVWGVTSTKALTVPKGNFSSLGNAQQIVADYTARTFIGSTFTKGEDKNPPKLDADLYQYDTTDPTYDESEAVGGLPSVDYEYQAQRWHLKVGTPSSTVFVESGKEPNDENIKELKKSDGVVLLAVDIKAVGELWALHYDQLGIDSVTVTKKGKTRTFNLDGTGIPTVLALYDLDTTAYEDVNTQGSH